MKKRAGGKLGVIILCPILLSGVLLVLSYGGDKYPKLSLRLSGEAGIVVIGDINEGLRTFNRSPNFEYFRKYDPEGGRVEGEIRSLNNLFASWMPEIRVDLSQRVSWGFSIGPKLRRQNESTLTYYSMSSGTAWPYEYYYKPEIWASSPVRTTVYLDLGKGARLSSFLSAGVGYYRGGLREQFNLTTIDGFPGDVDWSRRFWETRSKSAIGFHIGWGMEMALTQKIALIGEVQWRYARIGNFDASMRYETSTPSNEVTTGWLYYYTRDDPLLGGQYADLSVWYEPPWASFDIGNIRKARLDLGGVSLSLGLKLQLF